jgi:V/A-type H+-transporting ATPase subunit C
LKAKESDLDKEMVGRHLVEGGNISTKELLEIYGVKNVTEIIGRIEARFKLAEALEQYKTTNSLIDFEIAIAKFINTTYVNKLKNIALSIGTIFYFIFNAENEHENLKRITYGKRYNLSNERISSMLLI